MDSGKDNTMESSNGREQQSRCQTSRSKPLDFPAKETGADKSIVPEYRMMSRRLSRLSNSGLNLQEPSARAVLA